MRFKYSSVRASIAGSFVFPIHATLIFTGLPPLRLCPTPEPRRHRSGSHPPRDIAPSPPSPRLGSPATLPPGPVPASAGRSSRVLLRRGSSLPADAGTGPGGRVAGRELPRRRSTRELLPRLPAKSRANCESTPRPREIPRRRAPLRESPPPRIETDRILPVQAWLRPHAGAQSSWWFANRVARWAPTRQSWHELWASTHGAVRPRLVRHR